MVKLDARKIIYIVLAIVTAFPYIYPLGIPVAISKTTNSFYNKLESLPEDSVVVYSIDVGLGMFTELGPGTIAVAQHLLDLPIKLIITGGTAELPAIWEHSARSNPSARPAVSSP